MKVVNFIEAKKVIEQEKVKSNKKKKILEKIEKDKQSDSAKFNYAFYQLVDCFLQEEFPDAFWKFGVWLNKIENN